MSHLSLPRIHFKGKFVVNPGTGNNEDSMTLPTMVGSQVKANIDSKTTRDDFRKQMESLGPLRALWNYYGDNDCFFDEAYVTSVEMRDYGHSLARRVIDPKEDSLIDASVGLNQAVMVEVNSLSTRGTQIFADEFVVQKDIAGSRGLYIQGQPTPSYVRWYNRTRNVDKKLRGFPTFSAVFQFSLPRTSLSLRDLGNSPVLAEIRQALEEERVLGLTVRICLYLVNTTFGMQLKPRDREAEMARVFAGGIKVENPAIGRVVGTLGLWHKDELASVTLGRLLVNRNNKKSTCGPVVAVVDESRHVVTLDMVNAISEKDASGEKVDLGRISLVVNQGQEYEVGSIDFDNYNRDAYERTAGVLEFPYQTELSEIIQTGSLALRSQQLPLPLVTEVPYMIDSDDRCIYMQKGEVRSFTIYGRHLGECDGPPTILDVTHIKEESTAEEVALMVMKHGGYSVTEPTIIQVIGPQLVLLRPGHPSTIVVKATEIGAALLFFRTDVSQEPNFGMDFYINICVLPDDSNLDNIKDCQLTFDVVYQEVLQYYDLLHPAMSRVFDIGRDENWTPRWAKRVLTRIDPNLKDRYSYMPRTRDLSEGRRRLLQRWCQRVIATRGDEFNDPKN